MLIGLFCRPTVCELLRTHNSLDSRQEYQISSLGGCIETKKKNAQKDALSAKDVLLYCS